MQGGSSVVFPMFNPLQKVFQTPALSTTTNGVSGMASEIHSTANVFRRYFEYISKKTK